MHVLGTMQEEMIPETSPDNVYLIYSAWKKANTGRNFFNLLHSLVQLCQMLTPQVLRCQVNMRTSMHLNFPILLFTAHDFCFFFFNPCFTHCHDSQVTAKYNLFYETECVFTPYE